MVQINVLNVSDITERSVHKNNDQQFLCKWLINSIDINFIEVSIASIYKLTFSVVIHELILSLRKSCNKISSKRKLVSWKMKKKLRKFYFAFFCEGKN